MIEGLNNKQKEAVNHDVGPLLIAAGAGSGKTKTLTSRIIRLIESGIAPEKILAITFTNKAAEEMRRRIWSKELGIRGNEMFVGTFHSLGARILKAEAAYWDRTANYTIFDEDDSMSLIKKVTKAMDLNKEQYPPTMVRAIISKTKDELWEHPRGDIFIRAFNRYEEALTTNNAFDFDDLIQKVVLMFLEDKAILQKYQSRWQYILVDEFQDINTSQYELVKLLARPHQNLFVIGDDFQSIYQFRGADYRNFLNFEKDWPSAKVVLLEQNYRSQPTIVRAANNVIANNKLQKPKTLWSDKPAGELVTVIGTNNDNDEAEWVVSKIIELIRPCEGKNLGGMAILYRTNAQSRAIEQNLIIARIPYRIFGGIRFYDRKEVKDLVAALRLAHNPSDTVSAERLLKNFPKKVSAHLIATLPRLAGELNVVELINYVLNESDYFELLEKHHPNYQERIENVNELIIFSGQFIKTGLGPLIEQISLASSAETPKDQTGVNLMTIHLAKGLEFKNVFVVGCDEGTLPHHRSYNEAGGIEEERRLMYVAMTRAQDRLFLTYHNMGSRFLYEIPPELIEFTNLQKINNRQEMEEEDNWIDYA